MDFLNNIDPDANFFNDLNQTNSCSSYNVTSMNNTFYCYKKQNLNVICFNMRSLNKNFDEFLAYIDHFNLKFDVIILWKLG